MLKCDLHLHTYDPHDGIFYSPKDMIDYMAKHGFDVISLTNHFKDVYCQELVDYAEKKGVLLIRGIELRLRGKDVLLYNCPGCEKVHTLRDLRKIKKKSNLIIAPHPYFVLDQCIGPELEKEPQLFDAIEYNHFYIKGINKNKKAEYMADKLKKPMVGNSDAHAFWQIGYTYTMIDADKKVDSVIEAIKHGKTRVVTVPLPYHLFLRRLFVVARIKAYQMLSSYHG